MSLTDAQMAAAFFAMPFINLSFIWLATCAAYAALYDKPIDGGDYD